MDYRNYNPSIEVELTDLTTGQYEIWATADIYPDGDMDNLKIKMWLLQEKKWINLYVDTDPYSTVIGMLDDMGLMANDWLGMAEYYIKKELKEQQD